MDVGRFENFSRVGTDLAGDYHAHVFVQYELSRLDARSLGGIPVGIFDHSVSDVSVSKIRKYMDLPNLGSNSALKSFPEDVKQIFPVGSADREMGECTWDSS